MIRHFIPFSFSVCSSIPTIISISIDSSNDGPSTRLHVFVNQRTARISSTGILRHTIDQCNFGVEPVFILLLWNCQLNLLQYRRLRRTLVSLTPAQSYSSLSSIVLKIRSYWMMCWKKYVHPKKKLLAGPYEICSAFAITIPAIATATIILNRRKIRGLVIVGTWTGLVLRSTSVFYY